MVPFPLDAEQYRATESSEINVMKAYRKQQQYIYRHCELCHVTTSYALIVGLCILMLRMLELTNEHVQLTTTYHMNHVPPPHMNFSRTPLELPALNNMLPAMVLQNQQAWSSIKCSSYTSPHSRVCRFPLYPRFHYSFCSGKEGGGCGGASTATDEWRH